MKAKWRRAAVEFRTLGCLLVLGMLFGASVGNSVASAQQFQHIVIVVQENRTPDNLFAGCPACIPGADIATTATISSGVVVPLTCIPLASYRELAHSHKIWVTMYDNGKLDHADKNGGRDSSWCGGYRSIHFVNQVDVQPYFDIASHYGFANRMFQTNRGPSFPAHQFLLAGTSAPSTDSDLFAAETVSGGCLATPKTVVTMIDPEGDENSSMYPCFEHGTLTDLLNAAGLTWRFYAPSAISAWTAPTAISHMCEAGTKNGQPACLGSDFQNVILNPPQILDDIATGNLANVSWVIPSGQYSDHPTSNNGMGPFWVTTVVDAIGNSSYWSSTAILITWDDWGGWYDHVPPPTNGTGWCVAYCYGFRVPLLVVSPFTPPGYIDNDVHDFGSILRFVEDNWSLTTIGTGLYADAYADNLSGFFQGPAMQFVPIVARHPGGFKRLPLINPDDDY